AIHGVRPDRAESSRGAAHAAPAALLGVDRAALGRSGVPGGVSLVQHPALLAGPDPRAARADLAHGGRAAQPVTRKLHAVLSRSTRTAATATSGSSRPTSAVAIISAPSSL